MDTLVHFSKIILIFVLIKVSLIANPFNIKFDSTYSDTIYIYNGISSVYGQNPDQFIGKYFIKDSLTVDLNNIENNISIFFPSTSTYLDFNSDSFSEIILKDNSDGSYYFVNKEKLKSSEADIKKSQFRSQFEKECANDTSLVDADYLKFISKYSEISREQFTIDDLYFISGIFFSKLEMGYRDFINWILNDSKNNRFNEALLHLLYTDIINSQLKFVEKDKLIKQIENYTFTEGGLFSLKQKSSYSNVLKGESAYSSKLLDSLLEKSNYSILYFTASWCGPCKLYVDSIKTSIELSKTLEHVDFYLFAMEASQNNVRKTIEEYGFDATIYLKGLNSNPLCKEFFIQNLPSMLVLRNGGLIHKNWISPLELPEYIRSLQL